jgi:membrane protease YdiL (CAAX protease family)
MEGLAEPLPRRPVRSAQGAAHSAAAVASAKVEVEQHSLARSIALHLLPGAALFAFVIAAAALGIAAFVALIAGIVLIIVPLELGYLLVQAKRRTGRWSVLEIVDYRERMSKRELLRTALPLVLWFLAMLFVSVALLDAPIAKALFSWYPESIREFASPEGGGTTPAWVMIGFFAAAFAINGVIGPVVEELYFRGYLLPRIARYGRKAAVLNAALFSLYHFWTPWQNPGRFLGLLPWVLTVQKTRSLRLSMAVHISVNNIFLLLMLAALR